MLKQEKIDIGEKTYRDINMRSLYKEAFLLT